MATTLPPSPSVDARRRPAVRSFPCSRHGSNRVGAVRFVTPVLPFWAGAVGRLDGRWKR